MTDHSAAVRKIVYPDYKPGENFPLWMQGYRGKIKLNCGLDESKANEINEAIVKSIPGKLSSGTALDAYNSLAAATKADYELLVKALTEEFLDPQTRDRFNEELGLNKRQAGQTIKQFIPTSPSSLGPETLEPPTHRESKMGLNGSRKVCATKRVRKTPTYAIT